MAYTKLTPRHTPGAHVEEISRGAEYRLIIPAGSAEKYRLAQLDDYTQILRSQFPLRSPLSLRLSARTSSDDIYGTWGFGLWNDPFGLSLGFGGNPFRLPALPNAVWFFGASKESYLSFRDSRASSTGFDMPSTNTQATQPPAPPGGTSQRDAANGFLAQSFRSPKYHPLLILAGLTLPFSRKSTRRLMSRVIAEDGIRLSVDVTEWHRYRLDWREKRVSFEIDDIQVFESEVSPSPPLGLVIWIDNQYAKFTPEGKIGFGVLENSEPAWLEIKDLELS